MLYNKCTLHSYMRVSGKRLYVIKKNCAGKLEYDMVSCWKKKKSGSLVLSVQTDLNTIHHSSYYIKN